MRQLSGQDASFIYQEQPHAPLNGASLNIYDEKFAQRQEKIFERDLAESRPITLEEWRSRPLAEKAWERAAALIGPQL